MRQQKEEWRKVHCPQCRYIIEYQPKEDFDGILKCPDCGKRFRVVGLEDFLK